MFEQAGLNQGFSAGDYIPSGTLLPAGAFAVITASSTTSTFWSIPGAAVVIVLPNDIGSNALANSDDRVILMNVASTTLDMVSWGDDTTAFNPSVPDVAENSGHSIARIDEDIDTNTAADWEDRTTPTPGQ